MKKGMKIMQVEIRNERADEERIVEEITRKAFWNLYFPGCGEHYLAHMLRKSDDFIPELNLVIINNNQIIGNIMYTKSCVIDENDQKLDTITFGPVSIDPKFQRKGFGSRLINHSIELSVDMGFAAVIIYGNPMNYCHLGFKGSKKYMISNSEGKYPCGLLVKPLKDGIFSDRKWKYYESKSYNMDMTKFDEFDATFEVIEKGYRYTQEEFSILSNAYVE
jgi:putative acetyltransferase